MAGLLGWPQGTFASKVSESDICHYLSGELEYDSPLL